MRREAFEPALDLQRTCTASRTAAAAAAAPAAPWIALAAFVSLAGAAAGADQVLVDFGSPMAYLANSADPGIGLNWTQAGFGDSSWQRGAYGTGYDTGGDASSLIRAAVPSGTSSVYTRARFTLSAIGASDRLFIGADYDDGFAAWLNGVEVFRSSQMPSGSLAWNTSASSHESSNGSAPSFGTPQDISARGLGALRTGENVLAVAVWNTDTASSDLVLVPRLVLGAGSAPPPPPPTSTALRRGPYLQIGTPTSVIVRWRTDTATASRVRYGRDPANLTSSADDADATSEHEVVLTGLSPATRYYYSVGTPQATLAGGDSNHFFVTPPAPGTRMPIRVWALGDSGTADSNARAVRDAYFTQSSSVHTDLWLMLGDNAYESGTDSEYQAAVFDMYPQMLRKSVLWPTLGNHDAKSANSSSQSGPYYDMFSLPTRAEAGGVASGTEAYYSFDHANVHFVCLDSMESSRSSSGAMLTWLRADLAATSQDWVIAFWHHPPYTKGSHDSDDEVELVEMRRNAGPILEAGGVDLVLCGHSHCYERSFLLDGHYGTSGTLSQGNLKDSGDGRPAGDGAYEKSPGGGPHEGAVYVVAGSSGKISGGSLDHPAMFISLNVLGSMVLDINGTRLDAKFLRNNGQVGDSFTIMKGVAPPNARPASPVNVRVTAIRTPQ